MTHMTTHKKATGMKTILILVMSSLISLGNGQDICSEATIEELYALYPDEQIWNGFDVWFAREQTGATENEIKGALGRSRLRIDYRQEEIYDFRDRFGIPNIGPARNISFDVRFQVNDALFTLSSALSSLWGAYFDILYSDNLAGDNWGEKYREAMTDLEWTRLHMRVVEISCRLAQEGAE